ncbi:META domain-containing protein [Frigidibacter sp. RF13]|uniref:META domain-containing protein n=1 Tax=Frigidibacter sp. RF13 TaxID=2997340 RepID=UPI00226DC1E6|nr:META domain-containing protein [Frigidibacter sp. RF13]MCY1128604.1 META domain-containing protein [Frigidibacter sp. RF13]
MDLGLSLGTLALVAFLAMLDTAWACVTPPFVPGTAATEQDQIDPRVADIAGLIWRVERIGDTPMPDGVYPFVTIAADGSASGSLVCNQFTTDYPIVGQKFAFGAFMTTRAACEGDGAALEERLVQALTTIEGFSLSEGGWTLMLERGEGAVELRRIIMR